jgi:micrococcal nuclease
VIGRALLVACIAAACSPAAANAATGPCRPDGGGPTCTIWTGKAVFFADGDTLDVDLAGGPTVRVRLTGIQAMEMTRYSKYRSRRRGACHAVPAANRLEAIVRAAGRRVRLLAQDAGSSSRGRPRRLLQVRRGGRRADVSTLLLREGHVLWDPGHEEWAMNAAHHDAAVQGATSARNLFSHRGCKVGPSAGAPLSLHVNWDADGDDHRNVNGEWVRVANGGAAGVPIAGWWIRDSAYRHFTFPAGATIPAGGSVTMFVGRGADGGTAFHWGLDVPVFENATGGPTHLGDGAYLFDRDGDVRAWEIYGG